MKQPCNATAAIMRRSPALFILALSAVVAGCSPHSDSPSLPGQPQLDVRQQGTGDSYASTYSLKTNLKEGASARIASTPVSGTVFPTYIVSGGGGLVEVWPPPYTKPSIEITKGLGPYAYEDALDSQDDLYVLSQPGSNVCQVTMYAPPNYHRVRTITPDGCDGGFWLEPNTNLLFPVGYTGCGANAVEEYSNNGKLLRTLSGFGSSTINATADTAGNVYVEGATETARSGYCYQSKPGVYVYEPGSSEPKYVITEGLRDDEFVEMTVDSTGYLYVEFDVPNPKKGYSPAWTEIVAYAPGATTPAYTIHRAPISSTWNIYSQNMETFNGQLYVGGSIQGADQLDVYQAHSDKLAYVIRQPNIPYAPNALAFDHTGTLYTLEDPYLTVFAPGQNTPLYTVSLGPCCGLVLFAVAW